MEDQERLRRLGSALMMGCLFISSCPFCEGQTLLVGPSWQAIFRSEPNGNASVATAVPIDGATMLVSVVTAGADAKEPTLKYGNVPFVGKSIGYDPVSKLIFLKVESAPPLKPTEWLNEIGGNIGSPLQALSPSGLIKCRSNGWVKQIGGKILPLSLLNISFEQAVPAPGTPLLDDAGRVAAIVFQDTGTANTAYAIPAEAVHRVRHDICSGSSLVRGWLGVTLLAENQSPKVVRVLPNSPAEHTGIHPDDVILSIGSRQISCYADAANAFFYLLPGSKVPIKLQRGPTQINLTITPERAPNK